MTAVAIACNFPCSGPASACTLYRIARGLRCHRRLRLGQIIARLGACLQARNRSTSGGGHRSVALLLFAPLFATLYVWTSPSIEHWNILGLTFLVLVGSALAVWWLVAATEAAVGWAQYRLARTPDSQKGNEGDEAKLSIGIK
jgi:hypothetical protein